MAYEEAKVKEKLHSIIKRTVDPSKKKSAIDRCEDIIHFLCSTMSDNKIDPTEALSHYDDTYVKEDLSRKLAANGKGRGMKRGRGGVPEIEVYDFSEEYAQRPYKKKRIEETAGWSIDLVNVILEMTLPYLDNLNQKVGETNTFGKFTNPLMTTKYIYSIKHNLINTIEITNKKDFTTTELQSLIKESPRYITQIVIKYDTLSSWVAENVVLGAAQFMSYFVHNPENALMITSVSIEEKSPVPLIFMKNGQEMVGFKEIFTPMHWIKYFKNLRYLTVGNLLNIIAPIECDLRVLNLTQSESIRSGLLLKLYPKSSREAKVGILRLDDIQCAAQKSLIEFIKGISVHQKVAKGEIIACGLPCKADKIEFQSFKMTKQCAISLKNLTIRNSERIVRKSFVDLFVK